MDAEGQLAQKPLPVLHSQWSECVFAAAALGQLKAVPQRLCSPLQVESKLVHVTDEWCIFYEE